MSSKIPAHRAVTNVRKGGSHKIEQHTKPKAKAKAEAEIPKTSSSPKGR